MTSMEIAALKLFESYPRKANKPGALRAIEGALNAGVSQKWIERKLDLLNRSLGPDEKRSAPYPETWFRERRWHDAVQKWRRVVPIDSVVLERDISFIEKEMALVKRDRDPFYYFDNGRLKPAGAEKLRALALSAALLRRELKKCVAKEDGE